MRLLFILLVMAAAGSVAAQSDTSGQDRDMQQIDCTLEKMLAAPSAYPDVSAPKAAGECLTEIPSKRAFSGRPNGAGATSSVYAEEVASIAKVAKTKYKRCASLLLPSEGFAANCKALLKGELLQKPALDQKDTNAR